MSKLQLDFTGVNKYIPFILLVGLGIGTTNYFIHEDLNWLQWIIQSLATSFIIGYALLLIANNKLVFRQISSTKWKLYGMLLVVFILIGVIATEVESIIKNLIFLDNDYVPFSSTGLYIPNSIISIFLGFSFFLNNRLFTEKKDNPDLNSEQKEINKIPIKQGDKIHLIAIEDIVYFEAYDNYSNLFQIDGKKLLCDYSLIFLENRLPKDFLRIHRKYIINTKHIKEIAPHLNGRYLIRFNTANLEPITSSKSYLKTMRSIVKID